MPETSDFINIYIQHLVKEVEELTKTKILGTAREAFKDTEIGELKEKVEELEKKSIEEKDSTTKTWQLALTEKEEEVSKLQHEMADMRRQLAAKTGEANVRSTNIDNMQKHIEDLEKLVKEKDRVIQSFEVNHKPAQEAVPKGKQKKNKVTDVTLLIE
jgi:chromosome segregation ATPase